MGSNLRQRLAAILVADASGYSRLMSVDDRATVAALDAARSVFRVQTEAHQGRIVDTAGDSVLAVFETAIGALSAALQIQLGLAKSEREVPPDRRMPFRIGIHLGDVMEKDDGSVYGDGVNIAARIQALAEPGMIVVSESIHAVVRGKVAASFVDRGQQIVKNIQHPVRIFDVTLEEVSCALPGGSPAGQESGRGRPAIAVLPFRVLADDRRLQFLADGLVEDVIALLARMPGFTLISHGSTFALQSHRGSAADVGRALGVRYVVDGSMREASGLVLVTVQLADAESGQLLWSGRFETDSGDATVLQDGIVRGIIAEIEPELTRAEIGVIRRLRPENLDAWAHYRLGVGAIATKGWTEDALQQARENFRLAFDADPGFALARAHFALITALGVNYQLVPRSTEVLEQAAEQAERAIADDDGSSEVMGLAGCALTDMGQSDRGMEILERAVMLDPSNAQAHVAMGATMAIAGDLDGGIARMQHGMRISPRDRRLGFWGWAVGGFLLRAGRIDEALAASRASASRDPRLFLSRILEAACLAALKRDTDAARAFASARKLRPQLSNSEIAASHGRRIAAMLAALVLASP